MVMENSNNKKPVQLTDFTFMTIQQKTRRQNYSYDFTKVKL